MQNEVHIIEPIISKIIHDTGKDAGGDICRVLIWEHQFDGLAKDIAQALLLDSDNFQKQQLGKRKQFYEKIHAAFVLETSYTKFGILTDEQENWIKSTYPNSKIETGTDQGGKYHTIEPKF